MLVAAAIAIPAPDVLPARSIAEGARYVRVTRDDPDQKKDLEGSESAYIAYPYVYPHYWGHYPYVVVGK
ncbi:hypothetical protein MTP99_001737 [Tenebrio molitor]|jgi:hypothetical protein|nr:hypothetical protein MTP99_001737 [Tenebrio molitor]